MIEITLSLIVYFFAPLLLGGLSLSRLKQIPTLLVFVSATIIQQVFFLLLAKFIGSYAISFPLAVVFTAVLGYCVIKIFAKENLFQGEVFNTYQSIPWIFFLTVFAVYLYIRSYYPFVAFINDGNEVGVEKLYNLSLHQSFLYGYGWPTEWIWLNGEPIRYYVFLKSIPGMISWIARVLFYAPDTGGALFILSEAFFVALTPAVMCAWLLWFGRNVYAEFTKGWAIILPLFGLLAIHFKGFWMGISSLTSGVNWWHFPDQVIPFTQSQYPVWLMLLADNHAYSQVYFLQVLLWGALFSLVTLLNRSIIGGIFVGLFGAAVLLSHPGSILVNLSTLVPFLVATLFYLYCEKKSFEAKIVIQNLLISGVVAAVTAALLYLSAGKIKVVFPEQKLLSSFLGILDQNFSLLFLLTVLTLFSWSKKNLQNLRSITVLVLLVLGALTFLFGRPGISVSIGAIALLYAVLWSNDPRKNVTALFAMSAFLILIPPEIIAFDHTLDRRVDWIRFQMSLRFWPESYILIPFALGVAFYSRTSDEMFMRRKAVLLLVLAVFIGLMTVSHIPGIQNRVSRSTQERSLDGFHEFYRRYPRDTRIINFLREQSDDQIVIAELCSAYGFPKIPEHFGWPGRIAAYSGRKGICGWGRHAALYNNPLSGVGFKGQTVEEKVMGFSRVYQRILSSSENAAIADIDRFDGAALRSYGVTHIVFGEWEKSLFPNMSVTILAKRINGAVVLSNDDGTGIVKIN